MLLTQIGRVLFSEPINGFADILSVRDESGEEILDRETLRTANRRARAIGEFRLEHARQTNYDEYVELCDTRGLEPDASSPPPAYYSGDFRDWPVEGETAI